MLILQSEKIMEVKILKDITKRENYSISYENIIKILDKTAIKFFPALCKKE